MGLFKKEVKMRMRITAIAHCANGKSHDVQYEVNPADVNFTSYEDQALLDLSARRWLPLKNLKGLVNPLLVESLLLSDVTVFEVKD